MSTCLDYRLHFPRDLTSLQVFEDLLTLNGVSTVHGLPVRLSVRYIDGRLEHRLCLGARSSTADKLPRLLPGLRLEEVEAASTSQAYVWRLWHSTSRRPLRTDNPELITRSILTSLMAARRGELLELRWRLGPVRRALSVGAHHAPVLSESWALALATAAIREPGDLDSEARQALRLKRREPAWRMQGHLVVGAVDRRRAQSLAGGLMAALRISEGPGVRLGVRRSSPAALHRRAWRWPLQANAQELVGLVAWPIQAAANGLPVNVQRARHLETHDRSLAPAAKSAAPPPARRSACPTTTHYAISCSPAQPALARAPSCST